MSESGESAFVKRAKAALDEAADRARDVHIAHAFVRTKRVAWVAALLATAAVAVLVTWLAMRTNDETARAFDGGLGRMPNASGITLDEHGRVSVLDNGDEHLVFRGGRLTRIEHVVDGELAGQIIDLDGRGRVVRVQLFERGVPGAWTEYDERGRVRASGDGPTR